MRMHQPTWEFTNLKNRKSTIVEWWEEYILWHLLLACHLFYLFLFIHDVHSIALVGKLNIIIVIIIITLFLHFHFVNFRMEFAYIVAKQSKWMRLVLACAVIIVFGCWIDREIATINILILFALAQ